MGHDSSTLDDLLAHADWMRGLARRLLGGGDEADDVVQEAWVSALRLPPARGRALRPWIATVMLNLVRSRARQKARTRAREARFDSPEPTPTAEELMARRDVERRLAALVLALAEPYRRTVLRRFHDGQSAAEIARAEGIPEGTVRWRLKHGLDELRGRFAQGDGGKRALGALFPMVGAPAAPALAPAASWLGAMVHGKVALVATSAVAALAIVATAGHQASPARAPAAVSRMVAAPPAASAARVRGPVIVREAPAPPQSEASPAASPAPPSPDTLTAITGIVRDSRGDAAARVPVTLRRLSGSGIADHTTTTDDAGRFSYRVPSRGSFMLTAELQGEPAARLEIPAPMKLGTRLTPSLEAAVASATIHVALDRRRVSARTLRPHRAPPGEVPSSWCCRQAAAAGGVVYGRACLRFDDGHRAERSGCELFGLKTQVRCQRRIHGGLSTGDLSRTDRLDCDGWLR